MSSPAGEETRGAARLAPPNGDEGDKFLPGFTSKGD